MQRKNLILLVEGPAMTRPHAKHVLDDLGAGGHVVAATISEMLRHLNAMKEQNPCVVLLTVDESNDDGLATLRTIKQDDRFKSIPVIVLGPAGNSRMVNESFGLGAVGYMTTSPEGPEFCETIRTLYQYWSLSELPQ